MRFCWQPNAKLCCFFVVFLPLTLLLAVWQLNRAEQKQAIQDVVSQQAQLPVIDYQQLPSNQHKNFRQVMVRGHFMPEKQFLLDNRVRHHLPGYEVLSVFKTINGQYMLVNRGWIAANRLRSDLPDVSLHSEQVTLFGYLYKGVGQAIELQQHQCSQSWPDVVQVIDTKHMDDCLFAPQSSMVLSSFRLRLSAASPLALETGWVITAVGPEKHIAYAIQWFALATLLLILTILTNTNFMPWISAKMRSDTVNTEYSDARPHRKGEPRESK